MATGLHDAKNAIFEKQSTIFFSLKILKYMYQSKVLDVGHLKMTFLFILKLEVTHMANMDLKQWAKKIQLTM